MASRQRYKVLVLGAPGVGKTALVRRLADGSFADGPRPRGLDFYTCSVPLRDDLTVCLQLWDASACPTTPDPDTGPLAAYLYNSQAVLLLYDVSSPPSLDMLRHTLSALASVTASSASARPYIALVAAKCDLAPTASETTAHELAARHGAVRFRVSARSGEGVESVLLRLACDLSGVPPSATEHRHRLAQADAADLGPSPQLPSPAALTLGFGAGAGGVVAARCRDIRDSTGRGPLYAPRQVAVAEADVRGLGAGGAGNASRNSSGRWRQGPGPGQALRPPSRSATPSPTPLLVNRTGPLGQRSVSPSPCPEGAATAARVTGRDESEGKDKEGAAGRAGGTRGRRGRWAALCCGCWPGGGRGQGA